MGFSSLFWAGPLRVPGAVSNQPASEKREQELYLGEFNSPGLKEACLASVTQNLIRWPHLTARKAGKRSLTVCSGKKALVDTLMSSRSLF